jgi:hypothetical protein
MEELEALEDLGMKHYENTGEVLYKETFSAIKEALAQPEQMPYITMPPSTPMWTIPLQRTWVGLTEAQCGVLWKMDMTPFEYYQAIEAKLKEKNS